MNKPDTVKLSIQIFRQNPPKLNGKENKGWKKKEKGREHPWDNHKGYSIHIMGIPEAEDREKGSQKIFEEIIENFPNMGKETDTQVQEEQSPKKQLGRTS